MIMCGARQSVSADFGAAYPQRFSVFVCMQLNCTLLPRRQADVRSSSRFVCSCSAATERLRRIVSFAGDTMQVAGFGKKLPDRAGNSRGPPRPLMFSTLTRRANAIVPQRAFAPTQTGRFQLILRLRWGGFLFFSRGFLSPNLNRKIFCASNDVDFDECFELRLPRFEAARSGSR